MTHQGNTNIYSGRGYHPTGRLLIKVAAPIAGLSTLSKVFCTNVQRFGVCVDCYDCGVIRALKCALHRSGIRKWRHVLVVIHVVVVVDCCAVCGDYPSLPPSGAINVVCESESAWGSV